MQVYVENSQLYCAQKIQTSHADFPSMGSMADPSLSVTIPHSYIYFHF